MTDEVKANFSLQGAGDGFKGRSSNIFGCLDVIEDKHSAVEKTQHKDGEILFKTEDHVDVIARNDSGSKYRKELKRKHDHGSNKGDDKDFKIPRALPPRRGSNTPDFKSHPKNWTFYNLADVDPTAMSEQSNRSAALSFLDDLKKRKETDSEDVDEPAETKIIFKKPKLSQNNPDEDEELKEESSKDKATHVGGKVVMPEFSFKSSKKTKKSKSVKSATKSDGGSSCGVKLGHLDEEDED